MTARWHVGPISGWAFWWLLVTSPEILIFLFFMITDPMTIPKGRVARLVYAVGVGLLATLLIAPQTTEYATKVAVLGALALVCAARPLLERLFPDRHVADSLRAWTGRLVQQRRLARGRLCPRRCGELRRAGRARRHPGSSRRRRRRRSLPSGGPCRRSPSRLRRASRRRSTPRPPARSRVTSSPTSTPSPTRCDCAIPSAPPSVPAAPGSSTFGDRSASARTSRSSSRATRRPRPTDAHSASARKLRGSSLQSRAYDSSPLYRGSTPMAEPKKREPVPFRRSCELALEQGRYRDHRLRSAAARRLPQSRRHRVSPVSAQPDRSAAVRLQNVARQVGLDFRQGAFRFGASNDLTAMMGGGLCWLDYDDDGWLDLFVVNSYADSDIARWESHGGLPRSALFHNVGGRFVNVSRASGADLAVQGEGCVAADFNGDGHTDLYVTTSSYDKLLWNNGDGTFTEGRRRRRDQVIRLARRRRGRGRQRRRPSGPVRGGLHGPQRPRAHLDRGLPLQLRRRA